jgi:hypothetical protein
MKGPPPGASWRDSARSAKLWIFDASASFPLLILAFHITMKTFHLRQLLRCCFSQASGNTVLVCLYSCGGLEVLLLGLVKLLFHGGLNEDKRV